MQHSQDINISFETTMMSSPTLITPLSPPCKKLSMKATQGATGGPNRALASFRTPHDGVASGACPDKPETEFKGVCVWG